MAARGPVAYCPECDQVAGSHVQLRTETYTVRGVEVVLDEVPVRVCLACGRDRVDEALDDAALVRAYCKAGLLECAGCGRWCGPGEHDQATGRCPSCKKALEAPHMTQGREPTSKKARVLVVEDDQDVRELVRLALEDEGYEVLGAQHGQEALRLLLDPNCVGLVLLDMRMPVMDGWQFAAALRGDAQQARNRELPIIVLTAAPDAARWAAEIGADAYLGKPFGLAALRQAVARFLGASEAPPFPRAPEEPEKPEGAGGGA